MVSRTLVRAIQGSRAAVASSSRTAIPGRPAWAIIRGSSSHLPFSTPPQCALHTSTTRLQTPSEGPGAGILDEIAIKTLTPSEYEQVADTDMDTMHDNLEILCEDHLQKAEVEYSSGVMTLSLPNGTYVINKQPPNQQIWISSPISGPARFGYSPEGIWVHHRRPGVTLGDLLDQELKPLLGDRADDWEGTGLR